MAEIISATVLMLVGLFVLVKGADYLVKGAADFSRYLKVSPILVGLTIVAFGTSLPELVVSIYAVFSGSADISLGNVIGSNIANIGLIVGIAALMTTLRVTSTTLIYEFPFLMVSSFLLLILASDQFIFGKNQFLLGRIDGLILLVIFVLFMFYVFYSMKKEKKSAKEEFKEEYQHKNPLWKNWLMILGGILAVVVGGRIFIFEASTVAQIVGISEAFIGLAVAALGTSLPELTTSIMAAVRKHSDLAVGNIVGSNIFNVLSVIGITSILKPIAVNPSLLAVDGMIMLGISLLFLVLATARKKLTRLSGAILLSTYIAYFTFLVVRL